MKATFSPTLTLMMACIAAGGTSAVFMASSDVQSNGMSSDSSWTGQFSELASSTKLMLA